MDDLFREWQATLPKNTATFFPKEHIQYLKGQVVEVREFIRKLQNGLARKPNDWLAQDLIEKAEAHLDTLSRDLRYMQTPKKNLPELDIPRAKNYPITELIEVKRGVTRCIWHDDENPSMKYYPKTNSVYCFVCQESGDAIDVASTLWGLNLPETVKRLTA